MRMRDSRIRPPPHLEKVALDELGETEEVRDESLTKLKRLIVEARSLALAEPGPSKNTGVVRFEHVDESDDFFLLPFLRCKKFRVEDAFVKVQEYARFLERNEWARSTPDYGMLREVFCNPRDGLRVLPGTDVDGRVVLLFEFKKAADDTGKIAMERMMRATFFVMMQLVRDRAEASICGVTVIENLDQMGVSFIGFNAAQRAAEKTAIKLLQDVYPIRLGKIIIMKEPWFVDALVALVSVFLSKKTKKRMMFIGDREDELHRIVPKEALPPNFGGTLEEPGAAQMESLILSLKTRLSCE